MIKKTALSYLFFMLAFSQTFAIEIPLSGAVERDRENKTSILFVDMERVFTAHPLVEQYKSELKNFANTRKTAIEDMAKEYKKMQEEFQQTSLKIVEAEEKKDEALLSELAARFEEIKKSLSAKKEQIEDLSKRTKDELSRMEENNSLTVLKEIETVIKEISRKRGGTVVLEKQSVLHAPENYQDITGEVIKQFSQKGAK
ncbi:MAG: OmpH family outer membrane protein [Endomicrobium sp.]|jgi:Skp family chaperone for outer membrane proteins|nr:OmpH family outer membrane protein [Endomicrobium sp.]